MFVPIRRFLWRVAERVRRHGSVVRCLCYSAGINRGLLLVARWVLELGAQWVRGRMDERVRCAQ